MPAALKLRKPLHPKGDRNRYCGPSAISILTGMGTGEAARLIRKVSGAEQVKGTSPVAVMMALGRCGIFSTRRATLTGKPTFAQWLSATHGKRGGRVFLLIAGNHFQVVSGNRYACGRTNDVVGIDHPSVKRRARVERVIEVHAPEGVTIPQEARKPPPSAQARVKASARYRAQKLARAWGLRIDREHDGCGYLWWVYGPDGVYDEDGEDDPCCGAHSCTDWSDVMQCVTAYVEDLTERGLSPATITSNEGHTQ
jgi:hypothetical protein